MAAKDLSAEPIKAASFGPLEAFCLSSVAPEGGDSGHLEKTPPARSSGEVFRSCPVVDAAH